MASLTQLVCLGQHLALQEMVLGTFLFFKTFPEAVLAPSTTDDSMKQMDYFLMQPKYHRCEVMMGKEMNR
jgi:cytochrome P450